MSDKDGLDTRIVQSGRRPEWTGPLVNPPVHRASTILFGSVAELRAAKPKDGVFDYGRHGTPTQWALSAALNDLEPGAAGTRLYPSGLAAVAAALLAVLKPGDELLMTDSAYGPTRILCDGELKRLGIRTHYYDPLIGGGIADLISDSTRAIFMESPGSLSFEVQDVPAIVAAAKARKVVTLLDNTWATPVFFQALAAGADLAILAGTKYIGGHSDVMIGSVTANAALWPVLDRSSRAFGQCVSPDDAYLATRGLRTLGVRLRQHQENGLKVARWLAEQPQVAKVLHPALPDCPGHAIWERDFSGASGLFSFVLNGGDGAARDRFIDQLHHFGLGYSWGGYESLVVPVDLARMRSVTRDLPKGPIVRLHIGLENVDDLIADLAAALARYG